MLWLCASGGESTAFDKAGLAYSGKAFQQGLHRSGAAPLEGAGDLFGGGGAQIGQGGAHGGDLFGQGFGPWGLGGGFLGAKVHRPLFTFGHGGMACGVLVVRAQPADYAARFLGGAFAVQVHQTVQDVVILYAYWNSYIRHANFDNGQGDRVDDRLYSLPMGAPVDLDETARLTGIETELTVTLAALTASGKRVIVLMPLPDPGFDVPDVLARKLWREGILEDRLTLPEANFRAYSAPAVGLMTAACAASGATCLDLSSAFCDGTDCLAVAGGKPLFFDANHLSLAGAARIVPALEAAAQP